MHLSGRGVTSDARRPTPDTRRPQRYYGVSRLAPLRPPVTGRIFEGCVPAGAPYVTRKSSCTPTEVALLSPPDALIFRLWGPVGAFASHTGQLCAKYLSHPVPAIPPVGGIALPRTEWADRFVSLLPLVLVQGKLGGQWWAPAGAVVSWTGQNRCSLSHCAGVIHVPYTDGAGRRGAGRQCLRGLYWADYLVPAPSTAASPPPGGHPNVWI